MTDFILQEDGSELVLEDSSGSLIQEVFIDYLIVSTLTRQFGSVLSSIRFTFTVELRRWSSTLPFQRWSASVMRKWNGILGRL